MEVSEKEIHLPLKKSECSLAHLNEGILQKSKELQTEEKEYISSTDVSLEKT